ncbi:fucose pyrophosphorylase domain-containing protein [Murimonas intestini]|uniref:Fucokinase n=1 Tax=Murimonas intestini TaxID=1337051 RepID=A0AB73T921_9FIRM|nr:L-fucokinase [Murimonas intestini]MCR1839496.1 bifunctional fucokinase/L-fucose-1-P-guanylyltransferase [Murimonas intestini]MCR1867962.1 bifunctional fucokinase/L-fucose-1-P-guanylyltransferase [Murimonas intestini]MCR1882400.1 bifunctional fucokinase/L-fucose-1-P-guanylyltransferase [Murimonas intestini]
MNREMFLAQSYRDAWSDYDYTCKNHDASRWDWVIITASNTKQAEAYQLQIDKRIKESCLPSNINFVIIPDLNNERIGSGGATLNVLYYLADKLGIENVKKQKILLLHSGGDSKRIPQYSACGKLFAPVPRVLPNGKKATIFDELLISVSGIPARTGAGMLVLPGDTEVLFNPLQLDLAACDAAGLSIKASIESGTEHGVFLQGNESFDKRNKNVSKFLHKQSEVVLRTAGAVDSYDKVDVDTGCIWLGSKIINALLELICINNKLSETTFKKFVNPKVCLSFYADFLYPMADESTLESYYKETPENVFSNELKECRTAIWEKLHTFHLSLVKMLPAEYIHFGMTHEMYDLLVHDIPKYYSLGWNKRILTNAVSGTVINSYVDESTVLLEDCFIEDCVIGKNCHIGSGSILSGIEIDNIEVPQNIVLHALKLNNSKYVCRIYGRNDNPKSSKTDTFLQSSLVRLMEKNGLDNSDLWDTPAASIWNAKIYCECDTLKESINMALCLYRIMNETASIEEFNKWKACVHYSLKDSFGEADVSAILKRQDDIEQLVRIKKCILSLDGNKPMINAISELGTPIAPDMFKSLLEYASISSFPLNMRIYLLLSTLCKQLNHTISGLNFINLEDKSYEIIRNEIIKATMEKHSFLFKQAKFVHEQVTCQLPVRVNFCGSPSDAAPYCLEHGGTMLDGALLLKGKLPVSVTVKHLEKPVVVFESIDQGEIVEISEISCIRNCNNLFDKFSLHKAVLVACGLIPTLDNGQSLQDICKIIGGGLKISTSVDVPKGSGLGTSSIIAAACIKALNQILNQDVSDECIYSQVFLAEQLMLTGGGWQDQVGGLKKGLKYFTSKPGLYQKIGVEYLDLEKNVFEELNQRFALIFSGQRRLARNVLHEEMNQCIRNDAEAMKSISKIREYCALMKYNLEKGDVTAFAHYITKQFELVKCLDKGASNTCIEYIFNVCDDLIDGKSICGAGGGGFLQVILKKGITKEQLKIRIEEEFSDCGVEVWDCQLI